MRERTFTAWVPMLLLCAVSSFGAADPESGSGRIIGQVFTSDDEPVSGVEVLLERRDQYYPPSSAIMQRTTKTSADGGFEFTDLAFGDYVWKVDTLDQLGLGAALLDARRTESNTRVDLLPGGPIAGRVINENDTPIVGAWIAPVVHDVEDYRTYSGWSAMLAVRSDADGRFQFDRLWNNAWRLVVFSPGYAPQLTSYFSVGDRDASITLKRASGIEGLVLEGLSGEPLPGTKVILSGENELDEAETLTDDQGVFRFDNLRPVAHQLRIEHDTLASERAFKTVRLREGERATDLQFDVYEGGRIEGYVTDADSSEGIANVTVAVNSVDDKTVVTDDFGYYQINGLARGTYDVNTWGKPGYQRNYSGGQKVSVALGTTVQDIDFSLTRSVSPITGIVRVPDGKPSGPRATVHAMMNRDMRMSRVSEDGTFAIDGVKPGQTFVLWARNNSGLLYATGESIVMPEGGLSNVVITLEEAGGISGKVLDQYDNPIPNPGIKFESAEYPDSNFGLRRMYLSGRFSIDALPAGTYTVWAEDTKEGYRSEPQTIELGSLEKIDSVRIRCEPLKTYQISGRVVDGAGKPISRARVKGQGGTARTDNTGAFTVKVTRAGHHQINAFHNDYPEWAFADTTAGATGVELVLSKGGTVAGRVIDAVSKEPVTEFDIAHFADDSSALRGYINPLNMERMEHVVDADGRFRLTGFRPGDLQIIVKADGFGPVVHTVAGINTGKVHDGIILEMARGAIVHGLVTDEHGIPLQRALILARSPAGPPPMGDRPLDAPVGKWKRQDYAQVGITDAEGLYRVSDLGSGKVDLAALHPESMGAAERIVLESGSETPVDFILEAAGALTGVIDLHGKPAAGVRLEVTALQRDEPTTNTLVARVGSGSGMRRVGRWETESGPDGRYFVGGLPESELRIKIELRLDLRNGIFKRTMHAASAVVAQETTELDFDFSDQGTELYGTVSADGAVPQMARIVVNAAENDGRQETFLFQLIRSGDYTIVGIPPGQWLVKVDSVNTKSGDRQYALDQPVLFESSIGHRKRLDFRFP